MLAEKVRERVDAMPAPVRVALLTHTATVGGAEIALARLAEHLDPRRCQVHYIVFADGALPDRLRDQGCAVEIIGLDPTLATADRHSIGRLSPRLVRNGIALARHTWTLQRRLRQMDVEVVHANSLKSGVIGALAARLARRPFVWYIHDRISEDYLPRRTARLVRLAARHLPAQVICNSQATLTSLCHPQPARTTIAYPGVERKAFEESVRPRPSAPLFGMVGRISPTKGQTIFLEAAADIARRYPDARFEIVGAALFNEQDYDTEVRHLATALGLDDRLRFTGHVVDVGGLLRRFSAVVHASPVPEPFGQVVVEAMAAGVPVIATAAGGVPEILDGGADGVLGLAVAPGDHRALAAAMAHVLEDPQGAESRAAQALVSVRRRFTIEQTAQIVVGSWERAAR